MEMQGRAWRPGDLHLKIVVTGGRGYGRISPMLTGEARRLREIEAAREQDHIIDVLDREEAAHPITMLGAGDAYGLDAFALRWAYLRRVPSKEFRANWTEEGPSAGPRRNFRMLSEIRPDKVIAFPGGRGTKDCVKQAIALGIEVIEVKL